MVTLSLANNHSMNIQKIVEYNRVNAEINQRLSFSNLDKLLKAVKNSPDNLSFSDHKKIQRDMTKMYGILLSQKSNRFKEKKAKINQACNSIERKLAPEARFERAYLTSTKLKNDLQNAVNKIESKYESLRSRSEHAGSELCDAIEKLPTEEAKKEAIAIIRRNSHYLFNSKTAITDRLFPSYREKVETKFGSFQYRSFNHPQKHLWTSLENKSRALQKAEEDVKVAKRYINDSSILDLAQPNAEGKVELNQQQLNLLDFAKKI